MFARVASDESPRQASGGETERADFTQAASTRVTHLTPDGNALPRTGVRRLRESESGYVNICFTDARITFMASGSPRTMAMR